MEASATRAISLILLASILGLFWDFDFTTKDSVIFSQIYNFKLIIGLFSFFCHCFWISLVYIATSFWSVATRMTGIWYFLNLGLVMFVFWGISTNRDRQNRMILTIIISNRFVLISFFLGPEGLGFLFKNYTSDGFTFGNSTFAGMYIFATFLLSFIIYCSQLIKMVDVRYPSHTCN